MLQYITISALNTKACEWEHETRRDNRTQSIVDVFNTLKKQKAVCIHTVCFYVIKMGLIINGGVRYA